jgi:hypothetical protein
MKRPDWTALDAPPGHHLPAVRAARSMVRRPAVPYAAFAIFAAMVALFAAPAPHRLWGSLAAAAYGCAAVASLSRRARARHVPLALTLAGAVLVPLGWLAAKGLAMPEVGVVERSSALLIQHGRLYQASGALAASHQLYGYDPYLPVMMIFGLPHAISGPGLLTDPRLWDGVAFAVLTGIALRVAGGSQVVRRTAVLVASPLIAFPLAVSGNDLPVLGLICLGLACAAARPRRPAPGGGTVVSQWRSTALRVAFPVAGARPVAAGLALGTAAAMKATAWPALIIVGVLFAARNGPGYAARFALAAAAALAALAGPVLATEPAALVQNTIMFPLGLTKTVSTAASPLPGHLLAELGPAGHLAAIALLVTAVAVVTAALLLSPPRSLPAATRLLVAVLTLMFTLAPASRWGYFVYPTGICAWLWLAGHAAPRPRAPAGPAGTRRVLVSVPA